MNMMVKNTKPRKSVYYECLEDLFGLHQYMGVKRELKGIVIFNSHVHFEKEFEVIFLSYISLLCVWTDLCHSVVPRKVSPRSGRLSAGKSGKKQTSNNLNF